MKKFFVLISCITSLNTFSQTITELKFPYQKGYHMHFKGTETQYTNGGGKTVLNSETYYDIQSGTNLNGMQTVVFQSKFISGKDTTFDNSPLSVNENGMCYWFPSDKGGYQKPVWAIKLPLTEGSQWKCTYNGHKANCRVVSLNTKVNTPMGEKEAICIETVVHLGWQNGYEQIEKILDFYNQDLGKVQITISFMWQSKDGKKTIPTMVIDEILQDVSGK